MRRLGSKSKGSAKTFLKAMSDINRIPFQVRLYRTAGMGYELDQAVIVLAINADHAAAIAGGRDYPACSVRDLTYQERQVYVRNMLDLSLAVG